MLTAFDISSSGTLGLPEQSSMVARSPALQLCAFYSCWGCSSCALSTVSMGRQIPVAAEIHGIQFSGGNRVTV